MRKLSPIGWAIQPLKNYARFSGRASRAEFWWFFLFMMIVYVAFWIVLLTAVGATVTPGDGHASVSPGTPTPPSFAMFGAFGAAGIFMIFFYLALLLPIIAVQVRRLHEVNRSGWWLGAFWLMYPIYMVLLFGSTMMMGQSATGLDPTSAIALGIVSLIFGLGFFIYSIVLLVFWCMPGTKGANRFGEDPYGPDVEQVFA